MSVPSRACNLFVHHCRCRFAVKIFRFKFGSDKINCEFTSSPPASAIPPNFLGLFPPEFARSISPQGKPMARFLTKGSFSSLSIALFSSIFANAAMIDIPLGTASSYAILAGSTITNTGLTLVHGDVGVWAGTAITGFSPGTITGTTHAGDAAALRAQMDLTAAYDAASSLQCGTNLSGQNLGGRTLTPGVYCFDSSAQLTGTLTLNSLGDPTSEFLFQIGSTLNTTSNSSVIFSNGGAGADLFWQVGSSVTIGNDTRFAGNVLALTSATLNTGATIPCGRILARDGAVTLDSNTISVNTSGCQTTDLSAVPETATLTLFSFGLTFILVLLRFRLSVSNH